MLSRLSLIFVVATLWGFAMSAEAQTTGPSVFVNKTPTAYAPIDYSFYDTIIKKVSVNEGGRPRLAYDFIRNQKNDFIGDYVLKLARQDVSHLSPNERLAYWLNIQNTLTIDAILKDGKGKRSLKKLRGTADEPGKLWTKPRLTIAGQNLSLQDIENKILTEFENPNVIYGLYQGVRGGPSLSSKAYNGATVNEMLAQNAKRYVNSKGIVAVKGDVVKVTPVFMWYRDIALGGGDMALMEHLKSHAYPNLKSALFRGKTYEMSSLNYRLDDYKIPKQETDASRSRGGGGYGS